MSIEDGKGPPSELEAHEANVVRSLDLASRRGRFEILLATLQNDPLLVAEVFRQLHPIIVINIEINLGRKVAIYSCCCSRFERVPENAPAPIRDLVIQKEGAAIEVRLNGSYD